MEVYNVAIKEGSALEAPCDLGGNIYKELPYGLLLEYVRGSAVHTLGQ